MSVHFLVVDPVVKLTRADLKRFAAAQVLVVRGKPEQFALLAGHSLPSLKSLDAMTRAALRALATVAKSSGGTQSYALFVQHLADELAPVPAKP